MSKGTWNGGGGPITQLAHDRWRIGEPERTSPLGVDHDLAAGGELVDAVTVLAAEIHERPFAIRLNLRPRPDARVAEVHRAAIGRRE